MIAQSVAELLADHVRLTVEGIDRMYLNVYVPRLQCAYGAVSCTADSRLGTRKTMIVALARKLLIALWRLVTTGETLEGVVLRPAG